MGYVVKNLYFKQSTKKTFMVKEDLGILISENTWDSILVVDHKGRIEYANPTFRNLVHFDLEDVNINDLLIEKKFHDIYFENLEILRSKKPLKKVLVYRKDNGEYLYLDTKILSLNHSSLSGRFLLVGSDISNVLAKSQRMSLLEIELNKSKTILEEFLYKSAHDLRGPIATIQGLINVAKTDGRPSEVAEYLDLISDNARKLDSLLLDLRHLTTIENNSFEKEPVNIKELVDDILKSIKKILPIQEYEIELRLDQKKLFYTSEFLLRKILTCLLHNACFYCKNPDDHKVVVELLEKREELKINISDNGKGIRPEIQRKIFNLFVKGESQSDQNGLGLFMTKLAVDKLEGRVELQSAYGAGTKVSVFLPSSRRN